MSNGPQWMSAPAPIEAPRMEGVALFMFPEALKEGPPSRKVCKGFASQKEYFARTGISHVRTVSRGPFCVSL